jgi:hypothetical protein
MALFTSILRAFRVIPTMPPNQPFFYNGDTLRNGDLSCDMFGALWVRQAPNSTGGGFDSARNFSYHVMSSDINSDIISIYPEGSITQFGGFNDSTIDYYIQLYNSNENPPPASQPIMTFYVKSKESFTWTPSKGGYLFGPTIDGGIMWAVSTTKFGLTPPAPIAPVYIYAEGYHGLIS